MNYRKIFLIVAVIVFASVPLAAQADYQIGPNPNNGLIVVDTADARNDAGFFDNNGIIEITAYGQLTNKWSIFTNSGTINNYGLLNYRECDLNGGVLNNYGTFSSDGMFVCMVNNYGDFSSYRFSDGNDVRVSGVNYGSMSVGANHLYINNLDNYGTLRNSSSPRPSYMSNVNNYGTILLDGNYSETRIGDTFNNYGTITANGDIFNYGTLKNNGTITGRVINLNTLLFEIGGLTAGEYGAIQSARFGGYWGESGGNTEFDFINGFLPQTGNYWDFLLSADKWENLENIRVNLDNNYTWEIDSIGNGKRLLITQSPVPLPSALLLLGSGLLRLAHYQRRKFASRS